MKSNLEAQVLETLKSTNIALKFHLCQRIKLRFNPLFYATNKNTQILYIKYNVWNFIQRILRRIFVAK